MSDQPSQPAALVSRAAPFLKWAGGKTQLLAQYDPLFPTGPVERYFEPFVGSGAVFFALRRRDFARSYHLFDSNPELINVYQVVRDQVEELITLLAEHRARHAADSRAHYYAVRELDRDPDWRRTAAPVVRAARMIYLNKTCYNGLWRVNSKGQFNVPLGRYKNPPILDEDKLRAASAALQGVALAVADFRSIVDCAAAGDFVYFDPPYVPLSATANFTSYAKDDFGEQDQRDLAEVFRALDRRGCRVMLSNADAPLVHTLYADFNLRLVTARRAINSHTARRGPIAEVVVTNYA
ncbi:MAG: DNA adenine methylase [Anaerolineae bacterium]